MYAAPAPIPAKPLGAYECQSVPQLLTLMYRAPSAITKSTTETLITTIAVLNSALSLMPTTRIAVMMRAMSKAGRFRPISIPNKMWRTQQDHAPSATARETAY
jgi:hypothetical protein